MFSWRLMLFFVLCAIEEQVSLAAIPGAIEPLRSYCLTHTDGFEVHGGESYLIVHHARMYPAAANNYWAIPSVDERLPLELCPSTHETRLTVRVLWRGEIRACAEITADLAGDKRIRGRADGSGDFSVDASRPGIYSFRSKEVEKTVGERDGKKYTGILHYSTLVVIVVRDRAGSNSLTRRAKPADSLPASRVYSSSINWSRWTSSRRPYFRPTSLSVPTCTKPKLALRCRLSSLPSATRAISE
jgi:hypothetical protein